MHGCVVDVQVRNLDVRIAFGNAVHDASEQPRSLEHVGLVHAHQLSAAAQRRFERYARDALDFVLGVALRVERHPALRSLLHALFSEVDAAGQLADHQDVESFAGDLFPERTRPCQLGVQRRGPEVRKEPQLLAELQHSLFRALFPRQMVELGAAHRTEQHGIRRFARLKRLVRQAVARRCNGSSSGEVFADLQLLTGGLPGPLQYLYTLPRDFGTCPVARQNGNCTHRLCSFRTLALFYTPLFTLY